jgi:uncharacterized membrane protein
MTRMEMARPRRKTTKESEDAMKRLGFGIAVLFCGTLGVSLDSSMARAQQPNATFQLAFCNLSKYPKVSAALIQKQAQNWEISGWYPVPLGECTSFGKFPRDTVYWYAEAIDDNGDVVARWTAADNDKDGIRQCVDHKKWYREILSTTPCPEGQESVHFFVKKVPPTVPIMTQTLE